MRKLNIQTLKELLEFNVGISFLREEISFLGLTSKIEIQLRDKLATSLYNEFKDRYIITREWKKCDLAILDRITQSPILLIELKSCYSCDLVKPSTLKEYVTEIEKDLEKSKKLSDINTEYYSILFVTKPKNRVPDHLLKVVKYSSAINRAFNKFDNHESIEMYGEAHLRNHLNILEEGTIRKDKAFDIECSFDFFIISNN